MTKAKIFYLSGTGNTKIVSEMIAKAMSSYGMKVDLQEVKKPFEEIDYEGYDLVGFSYPIHAFNTPKFFLDFIKRLPYVDNIPAFIVKTSGEPFRYNKASSFFLYRKLRRKGFNVIMDRHLLMPYNIMFRYPDSLVKQMYLHNQAMAKMIARKLENKQYQKLRYYPWHIILSLIFRLQWFGAWLNRPFIKVDKDKCTNCGLCVKRCPAGTIEMIEGSPRFVNRCIMCMRCVMECPEDAINFGIFNHWKVSGKYDFLRLVNDDSIKSDFINQNTKGYFRTFRKYFRKTQQELSESQIYQK